jgi:hypothetical protein
MAHAELIGNYSSEERDCDGKHVAEHVYRMTDKEKTEQFGDLNFMYRIVSNMVSVHAQKGTLTITQQDGQPRAEWQERTEEGYVNKVVTFEETGNE